MSLFQVVVIAEFYCNYKFHIFELKLWPLSEKKRKKEDETGVLN